MFAAWLDLRLNVKHLALVAACGTRQASEAIARG